MGKMSRKELLAKEMEMRSSILNPNSGRPFAQINAGTDILNKPVTEESNPKSVSEGTDNSIKTPSSQEESKTGVPKNEDIKEKPSAQEDVTPEETNVNVEKPIDETGADSKKEKKKSPVSVKVEDEKEKDLKPQKEPAVQENDTEHSKAEKKKKSKKDKTIVLTNAPAVKTGDKIERVFDKDGISVSQQELINHKAVFLSTEKSLWIRKYSKIWKLAASGTFWDFLIKWDISRGNIWDVPVEKQLELCKKDGTYNADSAKRTSIAISDAACERINEACIKTGIRINTYLNLLLDDVMNLFDK